MARASHACYTANRAKMATAEDLWAERFARVLWVRGGDVPRPWPALRAQCVRTRARAVAPPAGPLLLGYDVAHEAELQRERQAKQRALAKANAPPPPRRDVYVKGAMEWEKNAWRVWDKKKAQEEVRRDKYSTALTSYLAGNKIVVRDEPFALSQCAHCDQGGAPGFTQWPGSAASPCPSSQRSRTQAAAAALDTQGSGPSRHQASGGLRPPRLGPAEWPSSALCGEV